MLQPVSRSRTPRFLLRLALFSLLIFQIVPPPVFIATPVYAQTGEIGIAIGDLVDGSIMVPGEEDIYTFTATAGQQLFFDARAYTGGWPSVQLLDPEEQSVFEIGFSDAGPYRLLMNGVYRLIISKAGDSTGTYRFKLWDVPPPDQFPIAIGDFISNGVPGVGAGNIETPGVSDIYTFTATAGQQLFFDAREYTGGWPSVQLLDPEEQSVFEIGFSDAGPYRLLMNGVYRLIISKAGDNTGTYSFVLLDPNAPTPSPTPGEVTITPTATPTATGTAIITPSPTPTAIATATSTVPPTVTSTPPATDTATPFSTATAAPTSTPTATGTNPPTATHTATATATASPTATVTATPSPTFMPTPVCALFTVTLSGAQEVPPNNSTATGSATVLINTMVNLLHYELSYNGLTGAETAAHLHGFAASGANAGVLFTLPTGNPKVGDLSYSDDQEANLLNGLAYFNIHSSAFPGGELRGQLAGAMDAPCVLSTATPTLTPTETATVTPTATFAETATATPTATASATATGVPTLPPSPTATTTPTLTPTPTATPSATATTVTSTATPVGNGPAPVVISIDPNNGPDNQLTGVTIRGANFVGTPQVFLGDRAMSDVSRINAGQLLAQAPAGLTPGVYTVRVCNPDGQCGVLPNGYTVTGTGPTLSGMTPNQGYNDTPNEITLYGFNLQPGVIVMVGNLALSETVRINSTQVQVVVPAGLTAGTYDVTARNPASAATATLAAAYMVLDPIGDDFSAGAEDLWTTPLTIRQGETVLLGLNVHRQGGKTTRQVKVTFYQQLADGSRQEIGSVTTAPMAPGPEVVEAVFVEWNTTGLPSSVQVVAVIDPANQETETTKDNNSVSRHFTLLPPSADNEPPTITLLQANGGAPQTANAAISVTIEANDVGGNVVSMYLVEREFNSSARQWVAMQNTGWIPFQSPFAWTLSNRGGVRYIQAWVSDGAGNISEVTVKTRIDYNPPSDRVLAGQVRLYRRTVTAGQQVQVTVETLSGDADLYVWRPDGNQSWVSNQEGVTADTVTFTAPQSGDYQIEVFGYQASTYRLTISVGGAGQSRDTTTTMGYIAANKTPRSQPIIHPGNEPAGNAAVPVAPITEQPTAVRSLYMPLIVR